MSGANVVKKKHTQQELDQIKEYERRQQAGLNPAPLIKGISLEDVAGKQNVERVDAIENFEFTSISTIRGKSLKLITSSKKIALASTRPRIY